MLVTENKLEISVLVKSLINSKTDFVLYRLPGSKKFRILVSYKGFEEIENIDFEQLDEGFVFAPYSELFSKPLYLSSDFTKESSFENIFLDVSDLKCNLDEVSSSQQLEKFTLENTTATEDTASYIYEAEKILERIKRGEVRKVVLSRKKKLGELKEKNYFYAFKRLCDLYPDAFINCINLSRFNQIWMGASPEILVSQDKEGIFRTMSLAGTQPAFDKNEIEILPIDALWSHKEIEEQAIVGRYIINCLKKIRVREFEEEGPKTVKAGNLLHLRTSYSIDTKEVNFPNLSSVMLGLLHPTPAICGMPKERAETIIAEIESYNREFYSGYLGPVNIENESHLYVNLRTMKIESNEVYAFAGGGILEDSKPINEWFETEIKIDTIKKVFF